MGDIGEGLRSMKSPVPFLFGGLALMLLVIAIALLLLVCSHRKYSSSQSRTMVVDVGGGGDEISEPKIVVIMAGDTIPSYLANPQSIPNIYKGADLV
ncbi:protein GLUTAMINE DUMPER 5-like [Senna tora]|uniref:Protein GLUTAMINE DUMPER 5-like n=1 Tax=Senna tora TaxID=362788 RepID=A0A834SFS1_9FABA|nr:protein GLUTAMINE DUMPER 5-like [Senna tora]